MQLPRIMAWNCKGPASANFLRHFLKIIVVHKLNICILLETRVSSAFVEHIISKSKFTNVIAVEASSFAGDIWILWDC